METSIIENTGSTTSPIFIARTGTDNPFNAIDVGSHSAPTFSDVDGDGLVDMLVGDSGGNLLYFEYWVTCQSCFYGADRNGLLIPLMGSILGQGSVVLSLPLPMWTATAIRTWS